MGKNIFLPMMALLLPALMAEVVTAGMGPETQFLGSYQIGACDIPAIADKEKVWVTVENDTLRKVQVLNFGAYSADDAGSWGVRLGAGAIPYIGADGTETWETVFNGTEVTTELAFDRKGSDWPDLGYTTTATVSLNKADGTVTIEEQVKGRYGHQAKKMDRRSSCVLTSLANDPQQVMPIKIETLSNELETLAPDFGSGDLDQSSPNVSRLQLNIKDPSVEQIKEIVTIAALPSYPSYEDIAVTEFADVGQSKDTAEKAFSTVTSIANGFIDEAEDDTARAELKKEYQPLFDYVKKVENFLRNKPSYIKVNLIEWSESNSDGNGLLIIDTRTGQTIYIGASYYS